MASSYPPGPASSQLTHTLPIMQILNHTHLQLPGHAWTREDEMTLILKKAKTKNIVAKSNSYAYAESRKEEENQRLPKGLDMHSDRPHMSKESMRKPKEGGS